MSGEKFANNTIWSRSRQLPTPDISYRFRDSLQNGYFLECQDIINQENISKSIVMD